MSKALVRLLCKLIQRQTYSCLSTKYGIVLCFGGLLVALISLLQFGEVLIEWSMEKYSTKFNVYLDNVGGKSYQDRLCLPIPIDVVYTWVNGSDPKLLFELQKLKNELEADANNTNTDISSQRGNKTIIRNTRRRFHKRVSSQKGARVDLDVKCTYSDCAKSRIAVVVNTFKGKNMTLTKIQGLHPSFKLISKVLNYTSKGIVKDQIVLLYFPNSDSTHNALLEKVNVGPGQDRLTMFHGYFTTDNTLEKSVEAKNEVIVTGFHTYTDLAELHKELQNKFGRKISDISYEPKKHIAVVYFTDEKAAKSALEEYKLNYTVNGGTMLKVSQAFLTWTYSWSFIKEVNEPVYDEEDHVISANRFADNQELKYSLRSIEKFSPWVRNIYIVTNGQIPCWLNLDNPRIKVISHREIFLNESHLPTFSSPAIESHLHRIPGLSKKFVYMNDDVMFGDYVWPDDFYTHSKGQKIFLTWAVPNCNEGCPASWIQDKYCDKACNVSECDYDGGDCIGVKPGSRYQYQNWHNQQSKFRLDFCSTGCADTWVGDRYCDTACNVYNCGFDAGDCGIAQFDKLYNINIKQGIQEYHLPDGLQVVYFNLSAIFGNTKITEAEYSENMVIRTAILAQKYKTLTLNLRSNYTRTSAMFNIKGGNDTNTVSINFNVTFETTGTYDMTTTSPTSPTILTSVIPTIPEVKKSKDFTSIQILYSNHSINYWTVVNGSIPRPTWMEVDQGLYNIPQISNNTDLPQYIIHALGNLDAELKEGDITEKGYKRRKAKLLNDFVTADNYGNNDDKQIDDTIQGQHQKKGERSRYPSQKHGRHLLSLDYDEIKLLYNKENSQPPSDDEVFLANWIADSKRKQLSYHNDLDKDSKAWQERYGDWNPKKRHMETSFLPWERQYIFPDTQQKQVQMDKYSTLSKPGRRLLDTFADSLLYVHHIYNKKFGYTGRKVPAHMPHMIDVQIMNDLQSTFAEEFDKTSSHKLRSSEDMQFAFSYNYFVIGQTMTLNITKLFAELDTDHSGTLSDRELRTLAARIYPLPLRLSDIKDLEKKLINCSTTLKMETTLTPHPENTFEGGLPLITEALLSNCTEVTKLLNESKGIKKQYKHEIMGDEDVSFNMIRNNASLVLRQFDNIRALKKKFICLNDNIDHSQNATIVRDLLVDFYESLFPIPSQFELPEGYRNKFLYVEELDQWKQEKNDIRERNNKIIVAMVMFLVLVMFWRKVFKCLKWLCPLRRGFIPSINGNSRTRLQSI